ncbi:MAG TPA: alkaline phosphatase family protein [Fimbriiglobus sp.]
MKSSRVLPGFILIASVAFSTAARADDPGQLKVGLQADGRVVVPTNQILSPAGVQVTFPGRPVDLAWADGGSTLVVKNLKNLVFIDKATNQIIQTLASPVGFSVVGLDAGVGIVRVTDAKDRLRVAVRRADGKYAWGNPVEVPKPKSGSANPAGVAWASADTVWVTATRGNCVHLIDWKSGRTLQTVPVGVAPYTVVPVGKDKVYVSNWGGDMPKAGDTTAPSSGTATHVDKRGIADRGTISVLTRTDGKWARTKTLRVGLHPSGMVPSWDVRFLFVANANSDTVSVIRTVDDEVVETIVCRPEGRLPFGSGCNAVAIAPDNRTLYVANGTNNCVAVVKLGVKAGGEGDASRLAGLIPTGWYPGAIRLSGDGKTLYIANVKGLGSLARQKGNEKAPRLDAKGKNSHDHLGSISVIPVPDDAKLAEYTKTVNANNRLAYSLAGLEPARPDAKPKVIPDRHGEPSLIKHVIYVIKENRTYDQVFGDIKEGNGDPKLLLFGDNVTPNQHKLAREFTLLDNFYCSGVLSADGHQWVNEAYVTDYLEKAFGGFTRSYPYEGGDPLAFASSGFLWDNALEKKKTFRNYGEFVKVVAPRGSTWTDMYEEYKTGAGKFQPKATVNVAKLKPYTHPTYPGFVLSIPDVYRAKIFIEELKAFERKGELPEFIYLYLPCNHTSGTRPGSPTPRAMVADNDLALGRCVEAVSQSNFWKDTCFFVVEDDPQNGFDHVDGHRTVALVISPYTKRKAVDSTCYNQTGMVKTIELVLGLPPMNQLDLSATAMRNCFVGTPDLTPYTAVPNQIMLDEMNPPMKKLTGQALYWAQKSMELDLDDADEADEDTFNRILWHATRGYDVRYPAEYVGEKPGKEEEKQ